MVSRKNKTLKDFGWQHCATVECGVVDLNFPLFGTIKFDRSLKTQHTGLVKGSNVIV